MQTQRQLGASAASLEAKSAATSPFGSFRSASRRRWTSRFGVALASLVMLAACGPKSSDNPAKEPVIIEPVLSDDEPLGHSLENQAGLIITASPDVEIMIDGKSVGNTPITVEKLSEGAHDVTFMFEDDEKVTLSVNLGEGEFQKIHQSLAPDASDAVMGQ